MQSVRATSSAFPSRRDGNPLGRLRAMRHPIRRASVVGAGSFGTAVAILLDRAGVRTTLVCRTEEQARELDRTHQNDRYLPGVNLPSGLRFRWAADPHLGRTDAVFVAVPSRGFTEAVDELTRHGLPRDAAVISCAKGLVPPEGVPPTAHLEDKFGVDRVACIGGPAHAREM